MNRTGSCSRKVSVCNEIDESFTKNNLRYAVVILSFQTVAGAFRHAGKQNGLQKLQALLELSQNRAFKAPNLNHSCFVVVSVFNAYNLEGTLIGANLGKVGMALH